MSVNRYRSHVYVLPEDDANRAIASGFLLHPSLDVRAIQVLPSAGGWTHVRERFVNNYILTLNNNRDAHVVLLIDFDHHAGRRNDVRESIPEALRDRVFVIGAWSEPQAMRPDKLGGFEAIGMSLAEDCRSGSNSTWNHEQLMHNAEELQRMTPILKPILFASDAPGT